jgi:ankyrin repeat protein
MPLLLDRGADVNARQQLGFTPLHAAAGNGDEAMADLLLARGADATLKSDDGKTPADVAAERGHTNLAERLRVIIPSCEPRT